MAAGPALAAAVTNAGGLGVIGGVGYSPEMLRENIEELKADLKDKKAPFGVDLLLPKVGEGARPTNYDYTGGKLNELVDIIIHEGAKLFVAAVGVPPKSVVDKLHKAGIPVMNMIGHPKHVAHALKAGVDLICAQGGEGGGHTGDVPTSVLIPEVVELVRGKKSPLTGQPIYVVAAGGIYNGKSLAAALMYGAQAVWVGTRFVCATEAGAPKAHQDAVVGAGYDSTIRTIIFTGRPLRVLRNPYIMNWETKRRDEIRKLTSEGVIPVYHDIEAAEKKEEQNAAKQSSEAGYEQKTDDEHKAIEDFDLAEDARPWLMGKVAGAIREIKPAKEIIEEMVGEATQMIRQGNKLVGARASL